MSKLSDNRAGILALLLPFFINAMCAAQAPFYGPIDSDVEEGESDSSKDAMPPGSFMRAPDPDHEGRLQKSIIDTWDSRRIYDLATPDNFARQHAETRAKQSMVMMLASTSIRDLLAEHMDEEHTEEILLLWRMHAKLASEPLMQARQNTVDSTRTQVTFPEMDIQQEKIQRKLLFLRIELLQMKLDEYTRGMSQDVRQQLRDLVEGAMIMMATPEQIPAIPQEKPTQV